MDDSLLNEFIAESREHLENIEADLLEIESMGENINPELVNKVFRAAHSIKGGAGFFDLKNIQELAHKTENVLDLIRSGRLVPTPDVVNILLLAFDKLKEMINNPAQSNEIDVSELIVSLLGLTSANLPPSMKQSIQKEVKITAPGVKGEVVITELDYQRVKENGKYLYLVCYDLIDDVQRRGKKPIDILRELKETGEIVGTAFDITTVGSLDDLPTSQLNWLVLFSTILEPEHAQILFDIDGEKVHLIFDPNENLMEMQRAQESKQEVEVRDEALPIPEVTVAQVEMPIKKTPEQRGEILYAEAQREPLVKETPKDTTIRIRVELLEDLMNLAGELVLARNQLLEALSSGDKRILQTSVQRINVVTSDIQETIMLTRLQPIGNVFNKFPRVVRDMSRKLGKEINLEIYGSDVEMDKTLVEGLSDPLTHMVRNAIDHGIEPPEERLKKGKPKVGQLVLRAYHEAGQVVIEVKDDGSGIDAERVTQKAIAKGLITPDQARAMGEKERLAIIFLPGLSTKEMVTDLSGRGVGMDVVKTNLEKLGGKIEIESQIDRGTTFRIRLPLTLAILPSLMVAVGQDRFAIPQVHVKELIFIPPDQIKNRIEVVGNAEVLVLRGKLIPLVRLADALNMPRFYLDPKTGKLEPDRRKRIADRRSLHLDLETSAKEIESKKVVHFDRRSLKDRRSLQSGIHIVVLNAGALEYGLIVDKLHDTVEIVVKPLGKHLKDLKEYAGATIMGDGKVALVLDAAGIAAQCGLVSMEGTKRAEELASEVMAQEAEDRLNLLTFYNSEDEPCAVLLSRVERIMKIKGEEIEYIGGRRTIKHGKVSLPLVTLSDLARVKELDLEDEKVVILLKYKNHEVGLLGTMPVDAVEVRVVLDEKTLRQPGIAGSIIMDGRTTLLINVDELIENLFPEWVSEEVELDRERTFHQGPIVLLAEDSDFFRQYVKGFLIEEGYQVIEAHDGQEALDILREQSSKISLLLTDIEMPRLDGFSLTKIVKSDPRLSHLPVIALTSLASEEDIEKGKKVGVDEYQIKLDRENLVRAVKDLIFTKAKGGI
ncbi:MAG: chemotaxis protein CheW [Syntrophobacterales bacterium]|nr:chemotaxis protein CheW [Syntrophobacterales bacterium]